MGDVFYKSIDYPLYIQVPQGRVTSLVCGMLMVLYTCWAENQWHLFMFGGWTWRTVFLAVWLAAKDWVASFVLKHLDSIYKALAGIVALCIAYILDIMFQGREVDAVSMSFIIGVMLNVLAFALVKRDNSKAGQRLKDK
eukprot:CAMPEP_0113848148 /NCGR_PEP_ID=MMETSP0372-20130328/2297_1 /TAXON_ID=340204 /ORGANISM="Lankesteria abbotti" /LENGTH=138 /DNA_ID=CAMNT_0000817561 /DNA_START=232 /DNA_END=648 /DNA_ORIENTATION=+ /assembly_acc=CAM_ASM_000359